MEQIPYPIEHQERMKLANIIAERLMKRYDESVKAIGLYGSLTRNEDGPYSDIEMFCVLRTGGEAHADLVMKGNLQDASMLVSACDTLWSGLLSWAKERGYVLVAPDDIPF